MWKPTAAAIAAALAYAPANAQVATEHVVSDSLGISNQFRGFDGRLGTLESVRFQGTVSDSRYLGIYGPAGSPLGSVDYPVTVTSTGNATVFLLGTPLATATLFGETVVNGQAGNVSSAGAFDLLFTTDLLRFYSSTFGRQTYAVGSPSFQALDESGTNISVAQIGSCVGSRGCPSAGTTFAGTFTFNYKPAVSAVPEPVTWAMMVLGFGAIGFSMRRRTARHAPA